ncbi:MAG: hypothetical protein KF718_16910 [Polyangiaceae bacterium]|nr:hypothetical protein [Polyangiaceae bacterium]
MPLDPLLSAPPGHTTLDGELAAAAHLLLDVDAEITNATFDSARDELARRRLLVLVAGVLQIVITLQARLEAAAQPLERGGCPHCGWHRPPNGLGRCHRCSRLRVSHERRAMAADPPVRAPRGPGIAKAGVGRLARRTVRRA